MSADPIWFDIQRTDSDCCICSRCGMVLRPEAGSGPNGVYRHCGQIWVLQGRYAKRLPRDFWDRFDYGDIVPKTYRPQADEPAENDEFTELAG